MPKIKTCRAAAKRFKKTVIAVLRETPMSFAISSAFPFNDSSTLADMVTILESSPFLKIQFIK